MVPQFKVTSERRAGRSPNRTALTAGATITTMRTIATFTAALLVVIGIGVAIEAGVGSTTGVVGTVTGRMIQGGGPAGVRPQVVDGQVTLTNVFTGAAYRASSGKPAGYSIAVPPGTYDIGGISFDDYSDGHPMHAYGQSASVVVTAGRTMSVNLYVQIR